jgi:hypothetical protein
MRKIFLTLCTYPNNHSAKIIYERETKPRFLKYCEKHGFEFYEITKNVAEPYDVSFAKMFWIAELLPYLNNGDIITYMDIDCCIVDGRIPAIFEKDFSIAFESTGVLCMGMWSLKISDWTEKFINIFCSDEIQEENKDIPSWQLWHDNDAIYRLLGLEWGQGEELIGTRNTTPFTKEELKEHVGILPVEWDVTYDPDFIIQNPDNSDKIIMQCFKPELRKNIDQTIVRHLSAGSIFKPLAQRYFNKPMLI